MEMESKRLVVVVPNEASAPSRRALSSDDEAWKSYLENPLTAATKAMMSINGDEDGTAALGLLYDYYAVPKERRRCTSSCLKPADSSAFEPSNCGSMQLLNQHVQALRSMPVNLSLNGGGSSMSELQVSKSVTVSLPGDMVGGGRKGRGDCVQFALIKSEGQAPMLDSCTGSSYQDCLREPKKLVYKQSNGTLSLAGYLGNDHQSSSDSLYEDTVEKEMYHSSPSAGIVASHCGQLGSRSDSFRYSLDASMSLRPRHAEGPMAYLNRGQFYALTLSEPSFRSSLCRSRDKELGGPAGGVSSGGHGAKGSDLTQDSVVQSVIMVVFGEDKSRDEQLKNWKYWHSRQHTAKQRVLDIADYKESFSTIGNVEEIAYNAVSFTWDVSEEAKVFISVNCLSTDFSSQKGVKGMPLTIQIDTYSYSGCSGRPIHRAFTQIKVFCDKGAERKLRDEEKKQLRRRMKGKTVGSGTKSPVQRADSTLFRSMLDLDSQPVLFIPDAHFGNLQRAGQVFTFHTEGKGGKGGALMKRVLSVGEDNFCPSQSKRAREEVGRKILLYVRKECDEVFDALMLHSPTLKALLEAISEKYAVPVQKMAKVYQKSKKGVLVNMDDNMVEHYSNEDTFILAMESSADSLRVTLSEI